MHNLALHRQHLAPPIGSRVSVPQGSRSHFGHVSRLAVDGRTAVAVVGLVKNFV